MLCPGCGNEIESGEDCPVCEAGRQAKRPEQTGGSRSRLCPGCGNEIYGDEECGICTAGRAVRVRPSAAPEESADPEGLATHLCPSCGNEVYGDGPCEVCNSGAAIRKRRRTGWDLCPRCGNQVEDIHDCPVCREERAHKRPRPEGVPICPQCDDPLQGQDWEGVLVRICPNCQGAFFPPDGLETTLDKLRRNAVQADTSTVIAEFRDRPRLSLPRKVRYKACPDCGQAMVRRNYAGVSGIIVDLCGGHGVWVDQASFGALSDFISRGGDTFAARHSIRRR